MSTSTSSRSNITDAPGRHARDNDALPTVSSPSTSIDTTTELHNFLRTRRSIRRFKTDPVPDAVIQNVLATATHAPSAHHRQPWRFAVITTPTVKQDLADAMAVEFERDLASDGLPFEKIQSQIQRSRDRIISAPVLILLCLDRSEMDSYPDAKRHQAEYMMAAQSVAAAGLQLLLAAHAEGLGAVWACWPLFAPQTIRQTLNLPPAWEPQAMFFVGYAADHPKSRERKSLKEVVVFQ